MRQSQAGFLPAHLTSLSAILDLNTTPHRQSEEVEHVVSRYVNYLRNDRGLAKNSVLVYTPFIRGLLVDQVAKTGRVSVDAFDATLIRSFLLERVHGRSGEYARLLATALRSFFRFLFLCGDLPADLSASVPTVCKPHRAVVPTFLSPEQIDRVLAAIDRSTLTGRRDHAVLLKNQSSNFHSLCGNASFSRDWS
jgi:integrase/recombinase XerD